MLTMTEKQPVSWLPSPICGISKNKTNTAEILKHETTILGTTIPRGTTVFLCLLTQSYGRDIFFSLLMATELAPQSNVVPNFASTRPGRLLLDQPRPAVVRVVRQPPLPAGDRAGRAGRGHGALPGHAHVHHVGAAEDGHEGRGAAAGAGSATQEGEVFDRARWLRLTLVYVGQ